MEKGEGGSEEGLFQNPGNALEVKRDIEGRWREAITGNLNDYFRHQRKKKVREKKSGERRGEKKNRSATVPLKGSAEEVCAFDVNLRSTVVYVERDFW